MSASEMTSAEFAKEFRAKMEAEADKIRQGHLDRLAAKLKNPKLWDHSAAATKPADGVKIKG